MSDLLGVQAVGFLAGVTMRLVRYEIESGRLRAERVGKTWVVRWDAYEEWQKGRSERAKRDRRMKAPPAGCVAVA